MEDTTSEEINFKNLTGGRRQPVASLLTQRNGGVEMRTTESKYS